MKILFIAPYVPNAIRFRPYNLVRSLASLGHQVTVLAIASGADDITSAEELRSQGPDVQTVHLSSRRSLLNCMMALPTGIPLQAVYSWSQALANRSTELAFRGDSSRFDVVHVEHLRGSRYGLHLISESARRGFKLPVVWDSVDCISYLFRQASARSRQPFRRLLTTLELRRTEEYESYLLRQFRQVVITSPVDRQSLLDLLPQDDPRPPAISVIPNGVDLNYFCPDPLRRREEATLVVSGKMSYHANVAMVLHLMDDVMPLIWARRPDVRVVIVGKDPPARIRAYAGNSQVRITGTVPDIRPYLQTATVAVAPVVYAAGMQGKLLEAMACETPVVTTPGAVKALHAEPGRDFLVAEKPDDLSDAVIRLLDDESLRKAVGRAGRRYVEEHGQWKKVAEQLVDIYGKAAGVTTG